MPQSTRTPSRSAARFGRGAASTGTGRFSRPGGAPARPRRMPTRATSRTTSPRFGRMPGRKPKQQKGIAGMLTGMLPTGAASKVTPSSKTGKAGGFAALAGAAGVAFRNRDKLTAMLGRRQQDGGEAQTAPATPSATTPVTPRTDAAPPTGGI